MAVYYDFGALEPGAESAKLDIRRIPIRWPTGYFHPKVVLLLVERQIEESAGDEEVPALSLLVGVMSANLTRAGWWENVETAHFEELSPETKTSLRGDLLSLLRQVRTAAPQGADHAALIRIEKYLRPLDERRQWSSKGVLHPRIWCGGTAENPATRGSFTDFLTPLVPRDARPNLEVISPYLDESEVSGPLRELIEALDPREVRIFLPSGPDGEPLVSEPVFDAIASAPRTTWAKLPKDLLESGDSEKAALRRVHAKVYRLFSIHPNYEALFVGSVNLTHAGHGRGGNLEAGILIETESPRRLDWWLDADSRRPSRYPESSESEDSRAGPGAKLSLWYHWDVARADAYWDDDSPSPQLHLEAQGSPLFDLEPLEPKSTVRLGTDQATQLASMLASTSFVTVRIADQEDASILVQEDGMASKPSLLLNLTVADILRYWAELNESQRTALLEEKYTALVPVLSALLPKAPLGALEKRSFFQTFAGIFHAFGTLERDVWRALEEGREKEAVYRILGKKYDSLPQLLDRVQAHKSELDSVERYVLLLCARQLLKRLNDEEPTGFASRHLHEIREVEAKLLQLESARSALAPALGGDAEAFFQWYESWFLRRAVPIEESGS